MFTQLGMLQVDYLRKYIIYCKILYNVLNLAAGFTEFHTGPVMVEDENRPYAHARRLYKGTL